MEKNKFTYRDGVTIYLLAVLAAIAYQVVIGASDTGYFLPYGVFVLPQ